MSYLLNLENKGNLEFCVDLLSKGSAVAVPSETVYGLAGVATDSKALAKIFSLKNRPHFDPLIVHVLDLTHAKKFVKNISPIHLQLCEKFWPGPLTILFEKNEHIPDLCTSGSKYVAVRAPSHPVFRKILEKLNQPLAAPSANRFGSISPTNSKSVVLELSAYGLEAVVEGGNCEHGLESTVVKVLAEDSLEVIRLGSQSVESIQSALGTNVKIQIRRSGTGEMSDSPGQTKSHYAPKKTLYFIDSKDQDLSSLKKLISNKTFSVLSVFNNYSEIDFPWSQAKNIYTLSTREDDKEAASKLFQSLRDLDGNSSEILIACGAFSIQGLCLAIDDRLRRASASAGRV